MPGYSWLTYAQMRAALAARLDDSSKVYWVDAELGLYCIEALRTWQSLTRYWCDQFTFDTLSPSSPVNPFYDLTQQSNSLIPYTVTDQQLESLLAYNLIEKQPSPPGTWIGTDQFTITDLTNALQRRRDQFLVETGMVLSRSIVSGIIPGVGRVNLPDNIIDVRRLAWIDTLSGTWTPMWKGDEFAKQTIVPGWFTSPGTPTSFSVAVLPPVTLQLLPPPLNPGQFEMISVNAGATLNPTTGVLLGIPDDFTWVIRFGALADLFGQDGQARDVERAAYCEARWQEGIIAARAYTSVETAFINGTQVWVSSLFDLDTMSPGWQNTSAPPTQLLLGGWNLAALSPVPNNNSYEVMVDIVRNAPIPATDGAFIQLGREELDAVLDYAEHLAALKMGGSNFQATMRGYQNFKRLALVRNARLAAALRSGPQPLFDKGWREERERPRRSSDPVPVGISMDDQGQGGR